MRFHLFLSSVATLWRASDCFTIPGHLEAKSYKGLSSYVYTPISLPLYSASINEPTNIAEKNNEDNESDPSELVTQEGITLPELFPTLESSLSKLGFLTPTPIQEASAHLATNLNNILLIAPTGSGKTLVCSIQS